MNIFRGQNLLEFSDRFKSDEDYKEYLSGIKWWIHNSDQGTQYTSTQYIDVLKEHNIQISMDGKGRALDNIYIERFWKSIKYEKRYLNPPKGGLDLYQMVREYIDFYNTERRHTEIGKMPPDQIYNTKKIAS